ncbi:MAG TPA: DinB family protein [Terriglobales bacterium]|nr:DinB family protein [Terriglobales bacterium]
MRFAKLVIGFSVLLCCTASLFAQMAMPPAKTTGDALNAALAITEHEFVPAAEAMPEDKYDFAPTNGEFKGVRTFGQEVKHVAAANYTFASIVTGEKLTVDLGKDESGPDTVKTKADIVKFLNDSFAYLHKALASVNDKNELDQMDSPYGMKLAKLSWASFSVAHPMDHYGQMVEYLRMNGIVPPASRPRNK